MVLHHFDFYLGFTQALDRRHARNGDFRRLTAANRLGTRIPPILRMIVRRGILRGDQKHDSKSRHHGRPVIIFPHGRALSLTVSDAIP